MLEVPLSEPEHAALQRVLHEGSQVQQYRVQAVLFAAEGKTLHEIAGFGPLTAGQISYWLRRFCSGRTELFAPTDAAPTASPPPSISRTHIASPHKGRPVISTDDTIT